VYDMCNACPRRSSLNAIMSCSAPQCILYAMLVEMLKICGPNFLLMLNYRSFNCKCSEEY